MQDNEGDMTRNRAVKAVVRSFNRWAKDKTKEEIKSLIVRLVISGLGDSHNSFIVLRDKWLEERKAAGKGITLTLG
jgi:hypothetical protein